MQEAVVVHADGREELVLGINYRMKPDQDGKMPPYFAWVITVPNEPDRYQLAERDLFKEVFQWGNPKMEKRPFGEGKVPRSTDDGGELVWSKLVKVGPYTIQPVKATGMAALKGLNQWLDQNGFPSEDEGHMEYFVKNGFTFLCIKVRPAGDGERVPGAGPLKPLHLSFKSKEPYYPLRFSSRQGVFGVNIWMLTEDGIDPQKVAAVYRKLGAPSPVNDKGELGPFEKFNVQVARSEFPAPLLDILKKSPDKSLSAIREWKLNLIRAPKVNGMVKIADWPDDVFLPLASEKGG